MADVCTMLFMFSGIVEHRIIRTINDQIRGMPINWSDLFLERTEIDHAVLMNLDSTFDKVRSRILAQLEDVGRVAEQIEGLSLCNDGHGISLHGPKVINGRSSPGSGWPQTPFCRALR